MTNPDEAKEQFYSDLDALVNSISTEDKIYILSDFSAHAGTDAESWPGVIQHSAIGNCNSLLLLSFCFEQ